MRRYAAAQSLSVKTSRAASGPEYEPWLVMFIPRLPSLSKLCGHLHPNYLKFSLILCSVKRCHLPRLCLGLTRRSGLRAHPDSDASLLPSPTQCLGCTAVLAHRPANAARRVRGCCPLVCFPMPPNVACTGSVATKHGQAWLTCLRINSSYSVF